MNTTNDILNRCPHLLSPAHLAIADTGGKEKNPPHLQKLTEMLVKAWRTPNSRTAVILPFQHGKQLTHDTPILTECGWKTHGELKVGDYVFSPSGLPVKVLALSEDGKSDYLVHFSDGSKIQCHSRHEWYVYDRGNQRFIIAETQYIAGRKLKADTHFVFSVPRILPLIMPSQALALHPYALGAWLGDGNSDYPWLSHGGDDWEVVNGIIACGYKCTRRTLMRNELGESYYSVFNGMMAGLVGYCLLGNKHIPEDYLFASDEQRMELLAGLIDTDGNYSPEKREEFGGGGQYRFTNTNKRLIDQVAFLVRTLGFKPSIQEYEPTTTTSGIVGKERVYVIAFSPTRAIPCRLPRKQTIGLSEPCRVAITKIERCTPKPGRCIEVEGGLYLVGENLTPTHNSRRCSIYFPAWVLLLWPETRIALASYEETFACSFGAKVRDIVNRYGPAFGINLRDDTNAKGEWIIDSYEGGMVCKGRGGALTGRPADLLIIDDCIKNSEEAQSPTILENLWDWYCTVAYSRLGPTAPIVIIGTRWGPHDLFSRIEAEGKVGGDKFETLTFKAIATEGDLLGRKIGEALWPERVPLDRLEKIKKARPRWFRVCWQGESEGETGVHFQPKEWPRYTDVGDAWRVHAGINWDHYRKLECTILHAVDWAQSGKKKSNKTAIVTGALTPDGKILVLSVLNKLLRYEENAPALNEVCKLFANFAGDPMDTIVCSDDDMLSDAMMVECKRFRAIPPIKLLAIKSKSKINRAQASIIRSQNHMFLLPSIVYEWEEEMTDQLAAFTGEEGEEDDIADCFGILGRLANEFAPGEDQEEQEPVLGSIGFSGEW